ncbi:MAG: D-alanyl-D-alanine carboxypeptidase family protein, partial [Chloroflexota bacterium]
MPVRAFLPIALWISGLLAVAGSGPIMVSAQEAPFDITSEAYIVINADTGEIYAERNMHQPMAPASLTKIFTTIEAIESAPGNFEIVTDQSDMVDWEATQVGFSPGERFSLTDLLYGMMVPSGNEAARAVARALGSEPGDSPEQGVSRFMGQINNRVQAMGLTDTNLVNPDGWGVDGHRSSAYDIATFTMYALQYPRFIDAISAAKYEMPGGYELTNTNKRLDSQPDLVGSK